MWQHLMLQSDRASLYVQTCSELVHAGGRLSVQVCRALADHAKFEGLSILQCCSTRTDITCVRLLCMAGQDALQGSVIGLVRDLIFTHILSVHA